MNSICIKSQILLVTAIAVMSSGTTSAQTTSSQSRAVSAPPVVSEKTQPRKPVRRATSPPARVTVIADEPVVAPQVVTIVHRLSGIKMLRLLLRQTGELGTVTTIDPLAIRRDAHASIIAGWALDDGRTIAARLPQAAAEIELPPLPFSFEENSGQLPQPSTAAGASTRIHPEPDLTVVTRDGRRFVARYVGLDGLTGLSVLQISGAVTLPPTEVGSKKLSEGQRIQLFGPERTTPAGEVTPGVIYVHVGAIDAKVAELTLANSGKLERFTARANKLSPVLIGSVACDDAGNTLGIVEAIEGDSARVMPTETIRAATKRVLEKQASVPRPLLGVRGEPVELATRALFLAHGWREDQFKELIQKQVGILLTSVLPGTPAALASLHPGDVIVRVNQGDVKSAEEFSELLNEAGSGEQVRFTVRRPSSTAPEWVDVKLGSSWPAFDWKFFQEPKIGNAHPGGLASFGIETIALSSKLAAQLGAQGGLLVVAVQPESVAARGGLREGDVIQSIDGQPASYAIWTLTFQPDRQKKHVLSVVREHEKTSVVLEANN